MYRKNAVAIFLYNVGYKVWEKKTIDIGFKWKDFDLIFCSNFLRHNWKYLCRDLQKQIIKKTRFKNVNISNDWSHWKPLYLIGGVPWKFLIFITRFCRGERGKIVGTSFMLSSVKNHVLWVIWKQFARNFISETLQTTLGIFTKLEEKMNFI